MKSAAPLLLLMVLAACGDETPMRVPAGQWSAADANLFVAPSGTTLELTCRDAALPGSLALDGQGGFRVDTLVASYGITVNYYRATIEGSLDGTDLRLSVTPAGSQAPPEVYVLHQRSAPHLPRCG